MITYLVNGVFFVLVLILSLKQRKYQYTVSAVITLLYFVFTILQSNYDLVENSQVFGWLQKIMLVILAGYMIFIWLKSTNRKTDFLAVIFACIACLSRFIRTIVFNHYIDKMQAPGADIQMIYQDFSVYYRIANSVTYFALLLMLFCIAQQLGKAGQTKN